MLFCFPLMSPGLAVCFLFYRIVSDFVSVSLKLKFRISKTSTTVFKGFIQADVCMYT